MRCRVLRHRHGKIWAVCEHQGTWTILHGKERRDESGFWLFSHERRSKDVCDAQSAERAIYKKIASGYEEILGDSRWGYAVISRTEGIHVARVAPLINKAIEPEPQPVPPVRQEATAPLPPAVAIERLEDLSLVAIPF